MTAASALLASIPTSLWIGNKQLPGSTGATFEVVNLATGQGLAVVADATAVDGAAALDAAVEAQTG